MNEVTSTSWFLSSSQPSWLNAEPRFVPVNRQIFSKFDSILIPDLLLVHHCHCLWKNVDTQVGCFVIICMWIILVPMVLCQTLKKWMKHKRHLMVLGEQKLTWFLCHEWCFDMSALSMKVVRMKPAGIFQPWYADATAIHRPSEALALQF